jgi:plastocyanin
MKTKILLPVLLILISLSGFSKTWIVSNSGTTFSPASITINSGDSVKFTIGSNHNVVEVSKATYDANANTALPGFSLPYGGGTLLPAQFTAGTHYYVCTPHAAFGMKGIIIVQGSTGITETTPKMSISVYPNPSKGAFQVAVSGSLSNNSGKLEIYNLLGDKVYQTNITNSIAYVDLSNSPQGVYFLKLNDGEATVTKKIIRQ